MWYSFCRLMSQVAFAVCFRLRAIDRGRVPRTGGVLLVANHQSYLDPVIVAVGLPRAVSFMARRSLFKVAPFRWLIESLGAFPIDRGRPDIKALKEGIRRLRAGRIVVVYPEGTRTRDGSIGSFHSGFLMMAERAGVPVTPVAIVGADRAWHRSRALPRPAPIRVRYGEPLTPEEVKTKGRDLAAETIRQRIVAMVGREGGVRR